MSTRTDRVSARDSRWIPISMTTQVLHNVTNIWDSTGRGIRLSNDSTFMGFLEPLP